MDEHEYGLVMPFVVCSSTGGPYDDDAFVAGYECGLLDALLAQAPTEVAQPVHSPSLPQLDLIAMRHGFVMSSESTEYEEWATATFTRSDGSDSGDDDGTH